MTPKENIKKALDGLAQFIIMNDTGTDESASAIEWHGILKQALKEQDRYFQALCDIEKGEDVRKVLERTLT